jgi:hypothetical protein
MIKSSEDESKTPGFEIMSLFVVIALVLFWKRRRTS